MVLFLLLLPPMLWASASLIDRMLVDGDGKDARPGALMAIFGLFNLIAALLVGAWIALSGATLSVSCIALAANGSTHTIAMWLYLHALRNEETSRVVPWFQIVPIFGILGGTIVLGELPTLTQTAAILLLMIGGFAISVKNGIAKRKMMGLMLAACALLAVNDVVFAHFGREIEGASALFSDISGKAFWGLLFLTGKQSREGFVIGLKTKLGLQSTSEAFSIGADFFFDIGKLMIPVAIVQATACATPLFTLFGAVLLTAYLPRLLKEELGGALWKKLAGILLVITGGVILAVSL